MRKMEEKDIGGSGTDPRKGQDRKDDEEGILLKDTVRAFRSEPTFQRFRDVLDQLEKSFVWIPCTAVFGSLDQEAWNSLVREAGDDPDSLAGKEITSKEEIRLVPDILKSGEKLFFPVFSGISEMGEYGERFSKVQKPFPEAVRMAAAGGTELDGIVLNAFTEPFVLDREAFDRM